MPMNAPLLVVRMQTTRRGRLLRRGKRVPTTRKLKYSNSTTEKKCFCELAYGQS